MADEPARVAWVTFDSPNRDGGGGNIRQAHLFAALARRASVDLYVAAADTEPQAVAAATKVIRIPAERRASSHRLQRRLNDLAMALVTGPPEAWTARPALRTIHRQLKQNGPYDVVVLEHPGLIGLRRRGGLGARWVVTMHNVGSERARQQAAATSGARQAWLIGREAAQAKRLELEGARRCESVIAVSDKDARLLAGAVTVVPNGVDLRRFEVTPLPAAPAVVLTGTLGYLPNVDGAAWFVREVWPLIRREVPDARLDLVGKAPVPSVRQLDGVEGIAVSADVPDIGPYLARGRVAIVPLRIGSGTRLKALDAMAAGRPVVGTTIGLEGLDVRAGHTVLVEDSPEGFAQSVVSLLRDDARASALVAAGHEYVEHHHDWTAIGEAFASHVLQLARS